MKGKNVSVIVLSYNTKAITNICLKKLKIAKDYTEKNLKNKIEVIVVDNASKDDSAQMVSKNHKWATLIKSKKNLGFAKGNNLAMKRSKGDYVLLLNSDSFIKKETLRKAVNYMDIHPDCDLLGCKLTYKDGSLQPSSGFLPSPINTFFWMFGIDKIPLIRDFIKPFHPNHKSFFNKTKPVDWIMGAFMFLKREVFKKTGGFDENYFMYTEEVEWCKRIKDKGFNVFYTPSFDIVHLGRASSKFDIKKPLIKEVKGVIYFFKKHYPNFICCAKLSIFFGSLTRFTIFLLLGKSQKALAYKDILKNL